MSAMRSSMFRIALFLVSIVNIGIARPLIAIACECTGKSGAKCTGTCCTTLSNGECQCRDAPCSS